MAGIGPSFAKTLVVEMGIRSVEELKQLKLNNYQQIGNCIFFDIFWSLKGLKYLEELKQRIPRAEMTELEVFLNLFWWIFLRKL